MEEYEIDCPFCGERIGVLIDCSAGTQQYTEDCHVCCSPIVLTIEIDPDGHISGVEANQENA